MEPEIDFSSSDSAKSVAAARLAYRDSPREGYRKVIYNGQIAPVGHRHAHFALQRDIGQKPEQIINSLRASIGYRRTAGRNGLAYALRSKHATAETKAKYLWNARVDFARCAFLALCIKTL